MKTSRLSWPIASLISLLPLFAVGQSQDAASSTDPPEAPTGHHSTTARRAPSLPPMTFATYNTGLAHGAVALADERLPLVETHLAEVNADVVCLQEVWTDDDAAAIEKALQDIYPYAFREVTTDTSEPRTPCGPLRTLRLKKCVEKKCEAKGISTEECVATGPCKKKYDALDDDCKRCLAANTAHPTGCALGGARDFVSEGRNGLLLLSKYPIEHARYVPHDTLLVKRGMIVADINGYHTICTHLSADLGVVPYPPGREFESWEDEHAAQVQTLADAADPDTCTVLLGDLNTGPQTDTLSGELPDNFQILIGAGYRETWDSSTCTWCRDNPLAGSDTDKRIDHILFHGCPPNLTYTYTRILDQPISIPGQAKPTRLSDHYGVKVTVAPAPEPGPEPGPAPAPAPAPSEPPPPSP